MTDFDMMVIDVTLPTEEAVERVSQLKQHLGEQDAAVVLVSVRRQLSKND